MVKDAIVTRRLGDLLAAVGVDPQFTPPELPRLIDELAFVPTDDGLIVEGGPERRLIRGRSAVPIVTSLMPLLDGTRSASEIVGDTDLAPAQVDLVLKALYVAGATEEGAGGVALEQPMLAFLRRMLDSTRVNRSGAEAFERLQKTKIEIVSDGETAAELRAALGGWGGTGARAHQLTIAFANSRQELEQLAARVLDASQSARVFPVVLDRTHLRLGPLVGGDSAICSRCVADDITALDTDFAPAANSIVGLAAGLAAAEVLALVTRVGTASARRLRATFDTRVWARTLELMPPAGLLLGVRRWRARR